MDRQAALAWLLYAAVALALLGVSAAIVLFCQPRSPRASSLAALAGASTLSAAPLQVSSRLVSAVCVSALYLALLALFTAPLDVFLLENALPHVPASVRALRVLYKSYFVALALYSFVGAPLVYNYAKQTEMAHLTLRFAAKDRLLAALKRTVCFLVGLAFVLLMAMVLLLCGKPASSDIDWLKPLLQWSSDLETFLRLVTGILVLLGTYLWLFVSARGLASVPVVGLLMEDHSVDENRNTFQDLLRENALEAQATVQTKETILRRYEVTQQMNAADLERLQQLQLREQLLQERRDVLDVNLQRFSLGSRLSCWKVPLGVLLLLLSLLLVASMLITTLDKMAHSSFKRGFLLNEPAFPNPVDGLLVLSSRFFPLDYVLFAVVFVYLFAVSLVVLARHGVAFLCFRLGRLQPRLTSSATMVVVSLVLAHVAFVGLFSVLTLAPQYATFGHQMYADEVTLCVRHCTLEEAAKSIATGSSHCRMSQLAHFYNALAVELPMFGTAFFLAQLAFCVLFVPWLAHAYLMAKRLPEDASDPKRERLLDNY
jgi:LMBR1 domain-containing protein 1